MASIMVRMSCKCCDQNVPPGNESTSPVKPFDVIVFVPSPWLMVKSLPENTILELVPPARAFVPGEALRAQVFNLGYDNFLGRLAVARVYEGSIKANQPLIIKHDGQADRKGKVVKLSTFKGISKVEHFWFRT